MAGRHSDLAFRELQGVNAHMCWLRQRVQTDTRHAGALQARVSGPGLDASPQPRCDLFTSVADAIEPSVLE